MLLVHDLVFQDDDHASCVSLEIEEKSTKITGNIKRDVQSIDTFLSRIYPMKILEGISVHLTRFLVAKKINQQ